MNSGGSVASVRAGYTNRFSGNSFWKRCADRGSRPVACLAFVVGAAQHAGELDLAEAGRVDDAGRRIGARRVGEDTSAGGLDP